MHSRVREQLRIFAIGACVLSAIGVSGAAHAQWRDAGRDRSAHNDRHDDRVYLVLNGERHHIKEHDTAYGIAGVLQHRGYRVEHENDAIKVRYRGRAPRISVVGGLAYDVSHSHGYLILRPSRHHDHHSGGYDGARYRSSHRGSYSHGYERSYRRYYPPRYGWTVRVGPVCR